jgi:hypothetical protein
LYRSESFLRALAGCQRRNLAWRMRLILFGKLEIIKLFINPDYISIGVKQSGIFRNTNVL